MSFRTRILKVLLASVLLVSVPWPSQAKSYGSGSGRSYSSHSSSSHSSGSSGSRSSGSPARSSGSSSSRSSSNSGSKSFSSGTGKSYGSGSSSSDSSRKGYSSAKSYGSGGGKDSTSSSHKDSTPSGGSRKETSSSGGFAFDTAAARARKEQASKEQFTQYRQSQGQRDNPPVTSPSSAGGRSVGSPPTAGSGSYRSKYYLPDDVTISTRPVRIYNVFNTYSTRPWVSYHDPYNSLFWWWLLDRSFDDRAWWAYHHRYDMDPARYEALIATDSQLQARVAQLEAQQVARDPAYVPPGLDGRDLMYSDHYVNRAYSNRSTRFGVISFWLFGIPMALGMCAFFIWLIWFKRWQTST